MRVVFEETNEEREVLRGCKRCRLYIDALTGGVQEAVVSPIGTAHSPGEYGMTACGIDATGDGWWWPL